VIQSLHGTRPKSLSNEQVLQFLAGRGPNSHGVLYFGEVARLVAFTTAQVYKALRTSAPAFLHDTIKVRLKCFSL
jgi:hypothetical protein